MNFLLQFIYSFSKHPHLKNKNKKTAYYLKLQDVKNFPGVQTGFRKGRGTRDQIVNIHWIIGKKEFQKNIYFCFTDYTKAFDSVDHNQLWKILRDGNTRPPYLPPEKSG